MPYINDPFELAVPPKLQDSEIDFEEEPRDYHDFFYDDIHISPDNTLYHSGIYTEACRFDEVGEHTYIAKNCPHFDAANEEGPRIRQGWTIQQNRRN